MKPRESLADLISHRQEWASSVLDKPGNFSVCEGCDSITPADQYVCECCHAYRFDASPGEVIERAIALYHAEDEFVLEDDRAVISGPLMSSTSRTPEGADPVVFLRPRDRQG